MKEASIDKMDVMTRNKIFKKYLNLKDLMKQKKVSVDEQNISDMLKDPNEVFDFMADCLNATLKGVSLEELEGNEADNLFSDNAEYILGMSGGASKN